MARKPGTKPAPKPKVVKEIKNYLNQKQLDEFSELLRNVPISVKDKELVAQAFCDHFEVKEKDRFLHNVNPEEHPTWIEVAI